MRDIVDIDAARGDVGGNQHVDSAIAKARERALANALALVAVDGSRGDAVLLEMLRDLVGAALGAREDNRAIDPGILEDVDQARGV